MVGDHEMWHRLALHADVVLMNQGVVWYRAHDDQESNIIHEFKLAYEAIRNEYLGHPDCPLTVEELNAIQLKRKRASRKAALLRMAKKLIK